MFFPVSKLFWLVAQPGNLLVIVLGLGALSQQQHLDAARRSRQGETRPGAIPPGNEMQQRASLWIGSRLIHELCLLVGGEAVHDALKRLALGLR